MPLKLFRTSGEIELPHKPIPVRTCRIVEQAIVRAWQWIIENPDTGFDLATALENGITHRLHETLFDIVYRRELVDGFNKDVFTVGTRGAELRNFDGSKRDLKPDLLVGFVKRPSVAYPTQDWLFIECKPVDAAHPVGSHYRDKGLVRFVRGDYAWTMTRALMVAYARAGYELMKELPAVVEDFGPRVVDEKFAGPVAISSHARTFCYHETKQKAPPIQVRHLWLLRG